MSAIIIKTPEEIKVMRHAGEVLTKTLDLMAESVRIGISTKELDEIAEKFICSHGGCTPGFKGYHGFQGSICTSINDEAVHGIPSSDRVLRNGDIVGVDCGVCYNGLHTDACRTFIVGEAPYEVKRFVKTTKDALRQAVKQVRPGGRIGDISEAIQSTLERFDYAPVIECTGHGVGHDLHEAPEILNAGKKGTGPVMQPGMVLAIEPISAMGHGDIRKAKDQWTLCTADGSLSAHFEETVLVTENGCEVLAK
ncbi:MAG: type I methionyl aminopeptidase [Patescibacteria group bacterium]